MQARLGGWIITGLLAVGLGGCSVLRLAWPQMPLFAHTWLDRHVGFSAEQSERVKELMAGWSAWQRTQQFAGHADLLAQWRQQAQGSLTPEQLCDASATLMKRVEASLLHLGPGVAEVAATLQPEQLQRMERHLAKGNEEMRRERLGADAAQAARQRMLDRLESFYGDLNEAQRAQVAAAMAQSPFDPAAWLVERQFQQRELLARLRQLQAEAAAPARWQSALREWMHHGFTSPRPAYRAYQRRLRQHYCGMVSQVHNLSTAAQRQKLGEKLKGWEDDLRALAGSASSS